MLGTPKRSRISERHAATRAEIVAAAWELCRSEGLAGLLLRDVARQVGMQPPSLYSYFASKHAIYDAMFAEASSDFLADQPPLDDGDVAGSLRRLLGYFVEFCTADPVRYQLLFQRTIPGFEPSAESFAPSATSIERISSWFEQVDLAGRLDLFTAIGTGFVDQQISNDPGGDRSIRLLDDAVDMFLNHVQAGPRRPRPARRRPA